MKSNRANTFLSAPPDRNGYPHKDARRPNGRSDKGAIKGVYVAKTKTLREDKKSGLSLILKTDQSQQSAGMNGGRKSILKQAAKSMNFLTENRLRLQRTEANRGIMTAHDAAAKAVKEVEQRMSDLSLLIKHTTTYRQLKPIYDEYRKSPDKEKYLRGHESEIILFEAAARALKEMQIKKLPDLAALRKEYRSFNDRKTKLYEDYRQAKKQNQTVVSENLESILYPSQAGRGSRSDKAQNMGWQVEC